MEAIDGTRAYDRRVSLPVTRMPPTSRSVHGPSRQALGNRFSFRPVPAGLALAFCAASAAANPQGGVVQAGSATITSSGNRLDVIQSSQRAVINWRSFSIGQGALVNFQQPPSGATLNRVTGPEMSAILGHLTANGTVFIVNPNGILIGPGAKVDVGGLVAATANISNENFMAGRYKFDEVLNRDAVIINRGEITARAGGLVALVAPGVENSGVIRAELGRVVLASGNRFTLDLFGDKLITFAVDDKVAARLTDIEGRPLKAYVNQTGTIVADGGSVLIAASAAKAVLDNVINTSGVVRATSFVQRGGEIVLHGGDEGVVRVAGTLDASGRASGASGGSVKVLGAEVVLDAGSRIDVAGDAGGGTALIGGGVQGGGGVPRSARTAIEAGATVNADALTRGSGGTIVAWSDGETRFAGALSARGGAAGGDGGFVEASSKRELAFNGAVDLAAPAGKGGRLLLDPESLIVDAATATNAANTLRSGGRVDLDATDTIEVRQPIDGRGGESGGSLTLTAGKGVTVDSDIVTNGAAVTLKGGDGGITMTKGNGASATNGNGTVIFTGTGDILLAAKGDLQVEHLVTRGNIGLRSDAGSVVLNQDLGGTLAPGIASVAIRAGRDVALQGVDSAGRIDVRTDGGTITVAGPLVAGGAVTLGDPTRRQATTVKLWNDVFTTGGDIDFNGTVLINPLPSPTGIRYQPRLLIAELGNALFETPLVQVAVQTMGAGSVRFNGDVLYDTSPANNRIQYVYNVQKPFDSFDRSNQLQVGALRSVQPFRPTGYYGLYVEVERGSVLFAGNLGTFDRNGKSTLVAAPATSLGTDNPAKSLWVKVDSKQNTGFNWISFDKLSKVEVSQFTVRETPVTGLFFAERPTTPFAPVIGLNLPRVRTSPPGDGPTVIPPSPRDVPEASGFFQLSEIRPLPVLARTVIAPSPRDVPEASGFFQLSEIRPLPVVPDGALLHALGNTVRDARSMDVSGSDDAEALRGVSNAADLGRAVGAYGAAADVFGPQRPPIASDGDLPSRADPNYFGRNVFDYVDATATVPALR